MDDTLAFVFTFFISFILLMVLISVGVFYSQQTPLADISKAYASIAAVEGGFSDARLNQMRSDLSDAGYNPSKITITTSSPDYPLANAKLNGTDFVPRGSRIILDIRYQERSMLGNMMNFLGAGGDIKNGIRRIVMSERYE